MWGSAHYCILWWYASPLLGPKTMFCACFPLPHVETTSSCSAWLDVDEYNLKNIQSIFSILLYSRILTASLQPGSLFLSGLLNPSEGIFTYNELLSGYSYWGMDTG